MVKFRIQKTDYISEKGRGKGVFATKTILKGEEIMPFEGKKVSLKEAIAKGNLESNTFQIGYKRYMDLVAPGVFANHSCNPSAGINNKYMLIAIKDISKGEEITHDYSCWMDEKLWTMKCFCKQKNCRKIIKDFIYLPKRLQKKYLQLGIVPKYITGKLKKED